MNLRDLNEQQLDELVADATATINSKGFKFVMDSLREQYVQELVQAEVGSLTAGSCHARMKVLEDVKASFQRIVNESKIRKSR